MPQPQSEKKEEKAYLYQDSFGEPQVTASPTYYENNMRNLYDNLVEDGYDMPSFTKFKHDLGDKKKVDILYNNLKQDGYELPNKEEFKTEVGLKKKEENLGWKDRIEEAFDGAGQVDLSDRSEDNPQAQLSSIANEPDEEAKQGIENTLEGEKSLEYENKLGQEDAFNFRDRIEEFTTKADSIYGEYQTQYNKLKDSLKNKYEKKLSQRTEEVSPNLTNQIDKERTKLLQQFEEELQQNQQRLAEKHNNEILEIAKDYNFEVTEDGQVKIPEKQIQKYRDQLARNFQNKVQADKEKEQDPYMQDVLERIAASSKQLINDLPANLAAISERLHNSVLKGINAGLGTELEEQTYWQDLAQSRQEETKKLLEESQRYDKTITQLIGDGEIGKAVAETGLQIAGQIPQLVTFIGTGAAGASKAGLATIATGVGANDYVEMIDEDINETTRWLKTLTSASSEYVFEGMTTVPIIKSFQRNASVVGDEVMENQIKDFFSNTFNKAMRRIYKGVSPGLMEASGEIGTELTQQWGDVAAGRMDPKQFGKGLGDVAITSFIIGEGLAGAGGALNMQNKSEAKDYLKGIYKNLPEYYDEKSKLESMKLIVKQDRLERNKQGVHKSLQGSFDSQIKAVEEQLQAIHDEQYRKTTEYAQMQERTVEQEQEGEAAQETLQQEAQPVYKVGSIQYENKDAFLEKVREFEGQEDTPDVTVENDQETSRQVEEILRPKQQQIELGQEKQITQAKARVLKTETENTFSQPIQVGEENVGEVTVQKKKDEWSIKRVDIDEEQQNQGYGKETYRNLNRQAQQQGARLVSDQANKINDNARNLWNSLVRSGEARELEDGRFEMLPEQRQTQQQQQQTQQETTQPAIPEKGVQFNMQGKRWEFTGEKNQAGDFVAKSLEQDPQEIGIAQSALETLDFVKQQQKKQPATKKQQPATQQAKAEPISKITVQEISEQDSEKARKVKEEFNEISREVLELPEGADTRQIGKRFAKIQNSLPDKHKTEFLQEFKKKQQKHRQRQQELEQSGMEFTEGPTEQKAEVMDMVGRIEKLDQGENPKKLFDRLRDIKENLTKEEEATLKEKLREKQEEYTRYKNEQRKEKARDYLDKGTSGLMDAIGGKKNITGEEIPKVHESLMNIARGSFDYSMLHSEELIRKIRDKIKESIPDKLRQRQVYKELQNIRPDIEAMFNRFKEGMLSEEDLKIDTKGVEEASMSMREAAAKKIGRDAINVEDFGIPSGMKKERRKAVQRAGIEGLVQRRQQLNYDIWETNYFTWQLRQNHTAEQLEVLPFLIEKTGVPDRLNRPDLQKAYEKYKDDPAMQQTIQTIKERHNKLWQRMKQVAPNLSDAQIQDYVTHIWNIPKNKRVEAIGWFKTQNKFLNKRYIPTLKEGIEKHGLFPKTLRMDEIMRIHGMTTVNAAANMEFVNYIKKLHGDGYPLVLPANRAPYGWKEINHPALNGVVFRYKVREEGTETVKETVLTEKQPAFVDPDLYPIVNRIMGENITTGNFVRGFERTISYIKKAQLTFSLFHHLALIETGIAKIGPYKTMESIIKIHRNLAQGKPPAYANTELAKKAVGEYAIQLGASYDVNWKGIQKDLDTFADKLQGILDKNIPKQLKILKFANAAKGFAKVNYGWDTYLWTYIHDGLKLYAVENLDQKMPKRIREGTQQQRKEWKINQGQLINDTFGGQNIEMVNGIFSNPKTWQFMKWTLLSRDWTLSTVRQALGVTGIGDVYKGFLGESATGKEKRQHYWDMHKGRMKEGFKFWARAGLYFGIGMNVLNAVFRGNDKEENPENYMNIVLSPDNRPPLFREEDTGKYYYKKDGNKVYLQKKADGFYRNGKKLSVVDGKTKIEDRKQKPPYIEDYMKTVQNKTMWGNTAGHRTLVFIGRTEEGEELYLRWGKQFREFPEFVSGPREFFKKLGGKASPPLQIAAQLFTGESLSGYENWSLEDKEGAEWLWGATETLAKSMAPFSMSSVIRGDKKFRPIEMAMPTNKGMTQYNAIEEFESAIQEFYETGHGEKILDIYTTAVQNGLPAWKLFKTAEASVRGSQTSKIARNFKTLQEVNEEIKQEKKKKNPDTIYLNKLQRRRITLKRDQIYFEHSREMSDKLLKYLNIEEKKFIKDFEGKMK